MPAKRVLMSHWSCISNHCRNKWIPDLLRVVAIWAFFIFLVETVAFTVSRDGTQSRSQHTVRHLAQQVESIDLQDVRIPRLARWDSFWFYEIAEAGYSDAMVDSGWPTTDHLAGARLGFLPLYPILVRYCSELTGQPLFVTAIWVSRICLLLSMLLLITIHPNDEFVTLRPIGLVSFPAAFIYISAYSESLFLCLVLLAFVTAQRGRHVASAIAAALAISCRINGIALIPALLVIGCQARTDRLPRLIPSIGAITGLLGLFVYYTSVNGDPFAYLSAKRRYWNSSPVWPWVTIDASIDRLLQAVAIADMGVWYTLLELPLFVVIGVVCIVLASERRWGEIAFVSTSVTLSLVSGSLWGFPRFVTFLFPVFVLFPRLSRRMPLLWCASLCLGGVFQCIFLINYVNFHAPAP